MSHRINGFMPPATGAGVDGYNTTVTTQGASGLDGYGGDLILKSGIGSADGYDGYLLLETGNRVLIALDGYNISYFKEFGSFGLGKSVVFLANATVTPTASPTGGGVLYVENGALKYVGPSGTITTLAPG